jgi:hypothetical protein
LTGSAAAVEPGEAPGVPGAVVCANVEGAAKASVTAPATASFFI